MSPRTPDRIRAAAARVAAVALLACASATSAYGAELVLADGRVLRGTELRLREGVYLLTLESGQVLTMPAALVRDAFRDTAGRPDVDSGPERDEPAPEATAETSSPGGGAEIPSDDPPAASVFDPRPPALDGLEKPSRLSNVDPDLDWTPEPAYEAKPLLGELTPSRFPDGPVDPRWTPDEGLDDPQRIPGFSPWRRQGAPVDSKWKPKDGFRDRDRPEPRDRR